MLMGDLLNFQRGNLVKRVEPVSALLFFLKPMAKSISIRLQNNEDWPGCHKPVIRPHYEMSLDLIQ